MNERIKELAGQCYEKHELLGTYEFNKEKFAELIVCECTKVLCENSELRACVIVGKHFMDTEE